MNVPELSTIHEQYLGLCRVTRERFAGALGGKLLLRAGFDTEGAAMVVAASVAGAASLCVDRDAEALRGGLRAGLCDFVVSTLDEALRILKNEVRRGLPVCVGLTADPVECLAAMVERGVQPDLLSVGEDSEASRAFVSRGAVELVRPEGDAGTSLLCWSVAADAARTMPRVARMAAEALDDGRADTAARRRWLELAPRYLGRSFAGRQCLRMTAVESAKFTERVGAEQRSVTIANGK
ncbi:MAG TPA: hypothetical protein VK819_03085 [Acidobacteriaceae bacterium]|nr:hypothetical protein [Acidobacteriaceae bacterium]